jgi:hypothetical protein
MKFDCPLHIDTPADMIAVVPFLLGFHPADSIVVIGTTGGRITFGARHDLPPPGEEDLLDISAVIARQRIDTAIVIGYGLAESVTPSALRLERGLRLFGIGVREVLRVTGDRWWSYLITDDCQPVEGSPCRPPDGVIATEATYRGQVALPDRSSLVAQVAAVTGSARAVVTAATDRARARLTTLIAEDARADRGGRWLRRAGREAVRGAESRSRAGRALHMDDLAWLTVLLTVPAVADYAVGRTSDDPWRIRLWTEVLRHAEPDLVPVPGCLLGLAAWRDGQGALARVAVDRALQADPMHEVASLLDQLLMRGISPRTVAWPSFIATVTSGGIPEPDRSTRDFPPADTLPPDVILPDFLPPDLTPDDPQPADVPSGEALSIDDLLKDVCPPDVLQLSELPANGLRSDAPESDAPHSDELVPKPTRPGTWPPNRPQAGVSAGGSLPGVPAGGVPPGVLAVGSQAGVPADASAACVFAGSRPRATADGGATDSEPRRSDGESPVTNRAERRASDKRAAQRRQGRPLRARGRKHRPTRHRA